MDIKITFPGNCKVNASIKDHEIKTDQPVHSGGDNTAPAPFDLFLSSLATCAGFYVMRFVTERGFPADSVELTMRTESDPVKHMISKITFDVRLPADFPPKYKKAIINAVNLCAVKKHIHEPPEFDTLVQIG